MLVKVDAGERCAQVNVASSLSLSLDIEFDFHRSLSICITSGIGGVMESMVRELVGWLGFILRRLEETICLKKSA